MLFIDLRSWILDDNSVGTRYVAAANAAADCSRMFEARLNGRLDARHCCRVDAAVCRYRRKQRVWIEEKDALDFCRRFE